MAVWLPSVQALQLDSGKVWLKLEPMVAVYVPFVFQTDVIASLVGVCPPERMHLAKLTGRSE